MEFHRPVLLEEVLRWMKVRDGGVYCDCTVGGGGHLLAMAAAARHARFIGLDRDPAAIDFARGTLAPYGNRIALFEADFQDLDLILKRLRVNAIDGALFDLGVSYHQLTTAARGFSFEREGRLLMQMSPATIPLAQRIRSATKKELACVLREYGDVRHAFRLAGLIYDARRTLATTTDLRRLIEGAVPARYFKKNLHQVFQALRIWVNDELTALKKGLRRAIDFLAAGARLIVISYHSGEDRIAKIMMRQETVARLHKKVIVPSAAEIETNPCARSAKMRVAEKCAA